jgi:hypothetical protein
MQQFVRGCSAAKETGANVQRAFVQIFIKSLAHDSVRVEHLLDSAFPINIHSVDIRMTADVLEPFRILFPLPSSSFAIRQDHIITRKTHGAPMP